MRCWRWHRCQTEPMIDLRLGDCLEVLATLEAASIDAVITDPPYLNTGTGSSRVSRVAAIPDERQFFDLWMRQIWGELARVLKPTGAAFMTIDWRGAMACERAACGSPLSFGGVGIWDKEQLGMGYMLRHSYECFVAARMPDWKPVNRSVYDVWRIKWGPTARKTGHQAEKPAELIERALDLLAPPEGGVVLDPFMGSGTTGVVAAQKGYRFIGIEREPEFHELSQRRIADAHGFGAQANLFA
jgi:site-specific DNA-methyltransferase (adenine-specific)